MTGAGIAVGVGAFAFADGVDPPMELCCQRSQPGQFCIGSEFGGWWKGLFDGRRPPNPSRGCRGTAVELLPNAEHDEAAPWKPHGIAIGPEFRKGLADEEELEEPPAPGTWVPSPNTCCARCGGAEAACGKSEYG